MCALYIDYIGWILFWGLLICIGVLEFPLYTYVEEVPSYVQAMP